MTTKIYVWCEPGGFRGYDCIGYAVAEDGKGLASHLSSDPEWSKHDMGLTSDWKHDIYAKYYPDGYELEWVDDVNSHVGLTEALRLNQENFEKEQSEQNKSE